MSWLVAYRCGEIISWSVARRPVTHARFVERRRSGTRLVFAREFASRELAERALSIVEAQPISQNIRLIERDNPDWQDILAIDLPRLVDPNPLVVLTIDRGPHDPRRPK